jgi:hypothetical protein
VKKHLARFSVLILLSLGEPCFPAEPVKVLILPFQIHAGSELDYLKLSLSEMLSTRLVSRRKIAILEDPRIEKVAEEQKGPNALKAARDLGRTLGAEWLIIGSFTKIGESLSFDALLINLDSEVRQETAFVEGRGVDNIIPKITELARSIHAKLVGEPLSTGKSVESHSNRSSGTTSG